MYAGLLAATLAFPAALSFDPHIAFARRWKHLWLGMAVVGVFFLAWDVVFTQLGVWGFNAAYVLGPHLANLPVEEVLFFAVVPFACLFVYETMGFYVPRGWFAVAPSLPAWVLAGVCLWVAFTSGGRLYTEVNFGAAGLLLLWVAQRPPCWLARFWVGYAVALAGFAVVNGVLTALPVVWYANEQTLSIRFITIPIEDFVYCLTLLLGNVLFYEHRKQKAILRIWLSGDRTQSES